ncbi:mucoidy inhibitor MuiA family protein [Algirhabdus cladophorae]|uniref:mucoidy inhibitor MuiA family protein n=1 Tax=Algirhabdus cladophorae TaxID=3377108 RepID=UPI003B8487C3
MRFGLVVSLAVLPMSAMADDVIARMDISAVTISSGMAEVTRTGSVTLPEGKHVLIVPARDNMFLPQIAAASGLTFGAVQASGAIALSEGQLDTPLQAELRQALDTAQNTVRDAQDALEQELALIIGYQLQIDYLRNLAKGGENGPSLPENLGESLAQMGALISELEAKILSANIERRVAEDAVRDAQVLRTKAENALQASAPFAATTAASRIPVTVATAGTYDLSMTYLVQGANWTPNYSIDLNTEASTIDVIRKVTLTNRTNAPWIDVAVTLSTDNPQRRLDGTAAQPNPVRVFEPQRRAKVSAGLAMDSMAAAPEPMMLEVAESFSPVIQGMSLSYVLNDIATVLPQSQTTSDFGTFDLTPAISNAANPRFDQTAFLLAETENDIGEPILPGQAYILRDGALIGETFVDLIPNGGEIAWGFGPVDHLQLEWTRLKRQEGDSGFIRKSNDQNESLRFTVTNLSDQPETVKAYYATPFSEQEDLTVSAKLTPRPTQRDVDDKRGVHVWELDLAAGGSQSVQLEFDLQWPDGQQISWQP